MGRVENVVDSTRFDRFETIHLPRCRSVIPEVDLRDTWKKSATCSMGRVENVVDSIRLNSIDSRRFVCLDVDPSSRKSICGTLRNNVQLGEWGGSRMLSIRLDLIDSRRFVCLDVDPSFRKSICATLRNNVQLAEWGGLKMLSIRLDLIDSRRFVFLDVDPSSWKSICATLRKKSATCSMGRVENVVDSTRFDRFETIRLP